MGLTARLVALASAVSIGALSRPSRADATSHPLVTLRIDACLGADPGEVRRIVGVELDALLADGEDTRNTTQVSAGCLGTGVLLEVVDPVTGKSLSRSVNIVSAPPPARPRLLALAIVELVSASWTELESNPDPAVPPASAPPSEEARAAARRSVQSRDLHATRAAVPTAPAPIDLEAPRDATSTRVLHRDERLQASAVHTWRAEGLVEGRALLAAPLASVGLGARLSKRGASGLGWGVDLLADHAERATSLGSVAVDAISAGPSLLLEESWGAFALEEGVGLRLGLASFSGTPRSSDQARGSSLVSPWGGPFASVGARVQAIHGLGFEAGVELGEAPFPAKALVDGARDVAIAGVWGGAHAGVVLEL